MSEVNAGDLRLIKSKNDVLVTYQGVGDDVKTGVEVELAYFDPEAPDLRPMTVAQNKIVKNATNTECGHDYARNEPTAEMLEIGSIPGVANDLKTIMADTQNKMECLTKQAATIGLKRSYFQHLPDKTASALLDNLMDVERYQAFFGPPRADMVDVAAYFSVCKSNQVSVSHAGPAHLLNNIRRLYCLAPFLFMALDNNAPFDEGAPFTGHAGMHHRASLGSRGGIPPYVFTATSGEDYIDNHIDHVMNNPLFVYYDETGKLIRLPSGTWTNFNELRERGLNTATNYFFSESILWPDVKVAALKDDAGQVTDHRYEARMLGVGLHQHQTGLLVVAALGFDDAFAQTIDTLLARYGFDLSNPQALTAPLNAAYAAALAHDQKFFDISYGTGTMADFARDFADALERSNFINTFADEIAPLLTICRTGFTDSKVNAALFPTLDKAKDFQRTHDANMFNNPNLCAYTLFEAEIK